jgi:Phage small terminase subunit
MTSPALRHKQKRLAIEAEKQQGKTEAQAQAVVMSSGKIPSEHDRNTLLAALDQDLERLHNRESKAEKIKLKADELMPKYLPHVDTYLASGGRYPNPLLVWCAIWAIDVDDLDTALRLADACVEQQQLAPQHFKRDLPTYLAEEIADWAERQLKAERSGSPYIDEVCNRLKQSTWASSNVIMRGKAFKVAGQLAEANGDDKEALAYFIQAQEENEKAGCKGRIKKLEEKLGVVAEPTEPAAE